MKKILITGASGFIGGFLVKEALNRGYETWAGVRSTSSRANLQDERIRFIDLKYSDRESLTAQLADFVREHGPWDYVIHNAGLTKTLDKRNFYRINAQNTANLIEALAASGCKPEKFLLMSSLSSYGRGDEKTFRPISLDDPQLPDTWKEQAGSGELFASPVLFPVCDPASDRGVWTGRERLLHGD